jgi:hypothetical protein
MMINGYVGRNNATIQEINVPHILSISNPNHLEFYNMLTSVVRYLYIKIEILNEHNNIVGEVSGIAINGSYKITADSAIRRTCDLTFSLTDGYLPKDNNSIFWINKKFKLYIGLSNIKQNKIYWFDKGVYIIKDPNINISINDNIIKITGLDKMALYSGDIDGQLTTQTIVTYESGATRSDVVKAIMIDGGEKESNIIIEDSTVMREVIPYDIESSIGDCTTDVLDKVIDILANYQYYYDLSGKFNFVSKPIRGNFRTNNIEWDFEQKNNVIISIDRNIDYANVKNRITVWGGLHDDGYQPSYTLALTDDNADFGDSPFTYEKLNEGFYRDYVEQFDDYVDAILDYETTGAIEVFYPHNICVKYSDNIYRCKDINGTTNRKLPPNGNKSQWQSICTTQHLEDITNKAIDGDEDSITEFNELMQQIHAYSIALCKAKANELMFNYYLANDTITITCVPIYSLDVNSVIIMNDELSGAKGFYVVKDISCQLNASGTMTITAHKLWD